jgi:hypothetical protein
MNPIRPSANPIIRNLSSCERLDLFIHGGGISVGDAAERGQFVPSSALGFDEIVKSVSRAPEIVASVRDVRMRTAAVEQSRLWNNPVLDATWSSIPIGRTNPTHLERPLANVPNYRVGVSYTSSNTSRTLSAMARKVNGFGIKDIFGPVRSYFIKMSSV